MSSDFGISPPALLLTLGLLLLAPAALAEEGAETEPKTKTVIGHVIPIGCRSHEPATDAAACSAGCLRHHPHDSLALQGTNGETFFLHGVDSDERDRLVEHAGSAVAVTGPFDWQGTFRSLGVDEVRPASAQEAKEAVKTDPEYEMTAYYMTFLRPGPKQKSFSQDEVQEIMKGHFNHMAVQARAGKLVIAGPFGEQKPVRRFSGIYIYRAGSVEEARDLTEQDPAVKAGYFEYETIAWYGPKSLSF